MQTEFVIALDKHVAEFVNIFTPKRAQSMQDSIKVMLITKVTLMQKCTKCQFQLFLQTEGEEVVMAESSATRKDWMNMDDLALAFQYMSI